MVDLGTLGGSTSAAFAVNERGEAAGYNSPVGDDPVPCGVLEKPGLARAVRVCDCSLRLSGWRHRINGITTAKGRDNKTGP
jgi:hypothetical protein